MSDDYGLMIFQVALPVRAELVVNAACALTSRSLKQQMMAYDSCMDPLASASMKDHEVLPCPLSLYTNLRRLLQSIFRSAWWLSPGAERLLHSRLLADEWP